MLSSRLNKIIDIEKGTQSLSPVGSPVLIYEKYLSTNASVWTRSSDVRFDENEKFVITTEFEMRYNDKTKVIDNTYRIKYNDKYYRIIEVIETQAKHAIKIIAIHFYVE